MIKQNEITRLGPNPKTGILIKGRNLYTQNTKGVYAQREDLMGTQREGGCLKPRTEALGEINHADT